MIRHKRIFSLALTACMLVPSVGVSAYSLSVDEQLLSHMVVTTESVNNGSNQLQDNYYELHAYENGIVVSDLYRNNEVVSRTLYRYEEDGQRSAQINIKDGSISSISYSQEDAQGNDLLSTINGSSLFLYENSYDEAGRWTAQQETSFNFEFDYDSEENGKNTFGKTDSAIRKTEKSFTYEYEEDEQGRILAKHTYQNGTELENYYMTYTYYEDGSSYLSSEVQEEQYLSDGTLAMRSKVLDMTYRYEFSYQDAAECMMDTVNPDECMQGIWIAPSENGREQLLTMESEEYSSFFRSFTALIVDSLSGGALWYENGEFMNVSWEQNGAGQINLSNVTVAGGSSGNYVLQYDADSDELIILEQGQEIGRLERL